MKGFIKNRMLAGYLVMFTACTFCTNYKGIYGFFVSILAGLVGAYSVLLWFTPDNRKSIFDTITEDSERKHDETK